MGFVVFVMVSFVRFCWACHATQGVLIWLSGGVCGRWAACALATPPIVFCASQWGGLSLAILKPSVLLPTAA